MGMSSVGVAKDVVTTMRESGRPELHVSPEIESSVVERLSELLELKALNILETKAEELKSEYEHTFCDCRIFTDLRPVFGGNPQESPSAMLLVHMLRMGYHDSNENRHKEFHIALDSSDLFALKEAIERAETKAKSLKASLEAAGIKSLDLT